MRSAVLILLLLSSSSWSLAQESRDTLVIEGVRVLSPAGTEWRADRTVVVSGERIVAIGGRDEVTVPADARHLDAGELYLLPGLIDLHSHLLLHPYDEASWNDQVLREMLELRVCRGVVAARETLESGFTTLRDLGTEGAGYADVGLKRAIDSGLIPGPRLFVVTRALVATGSYGPSGFDPRWELPKGAQVADGVDGVRRAVREQIAAGADWIKVYADYGRRPGDPATPTFSAAELEAIVDEARSAGLPVAAHAVTDEAIRRAVLAGVATIEHGYEASREILELMRERGVVLCPTLAASESMARYQGWTPGTPDHPRTRAAREMFARALEAGVTIGCGSDAGVFSHGDNVRELELMVEYGMAPADALRAATTVAARVLGQEQQLGSIAAGRFADLLLVAADPLASPAALRQPALVMKGGRIVVDRRQRAVEAEVIEVCRQFLDDYSNHRHEAVARRFAPGALIALDHVTADRQDVVLAADFLARQQARAAETASFREWIDGEPRVLVDHRLATVWAPYSLEVDGSRARGTDVFQLLRIEGEWKIVSLSYTSRGP